MKFRKLAGNEMARLSVDEYKQARKYPVTVLLHNIRSMYNVGSVFRTADAAGIEKVLISGYTATPPRKAIQKTALGADESVEWHYVESPVEELQRMKRDGVKVFGLEISEGSRLYTDLCRDDFPLCLILGHEVDGIDDELLQECKACLRWDVGRT